MGTIPNWSPTILNHLMVGHLMVNLLYPLRPFRRLGWSALQDRDPRWRQSSRDSGPRAWPGGLGSWGRRQCANGDHGMMKWWNVIRWFGYDRLVMMVSECLAMLWWFSNVYLVMVYLDLWITMIVVYQINPNHNFMIWAPRKSWMVSCLTSIYTLNISILCDSHGNKWILNAYAYLRSFITINDFKRPYHHWKWCHNDGHWWLWLLMAVTLIMVLAFIWH